jgi:HPt (histidine-containing phosphotransfer) domain-containing protein
MPRQLEALSKALEAGDGEAVRFAAHGLKGSAANVGGDQLRRLAAEAEQLARAGDLERVNALLARIDAASTVLREEMERSPGGGQ